MPKCQPLSEPLLQHHQGRISRGWALATYRQGIEAAKAGLSASANPYHDGSDQAAVWRGGWDAGSAAQ